MKTLFATMLLALALAFLSPPGLAQASSFSVSWGNEFKMDTLNLWVVDSPADGGVDFLSASLSDHKGRPMRGWDVTASSSMVFAQGKTTPPFKLFADVTFSENTQNFAVEWAEIWTKGNGDIKQMFTGTNYYTYEHGRGSWSFTKGDITNAPTTQAPTPIPATAWLLSSGLMLLMGTRFAFSRQRS
ncbi:MAG: hypothetical protein ACOCVM_02790 [Desulfovibrionaceae bacterium]